MASRGYNQDRWVDDDDEPYDHDGHLDHETTILCPHCDQSVYDDAEQCPHCGEYLSSEDAPRERKPLWVIVTVIIVLILTILAIFQ